MTPERSRRLMGAALVLLVGLSLISVAAALLGWYTGVVLLPFLFLFIPLSIPAFRGGGRSEKEQGGRDPDVRYCRECGRQVDPGMSFCPGCGAKL